jgi:hypothetical protein
MARHPFSTSLASPLSSLPSSCPFQCLVGFVCVCARACACGCVCVCACVCVCGILWLSSSLSILFFFPFPHWSPQTVSLLHSCPVILSLITIIILGPVFTNEWGYVIFGFLSLAYLTQHGDLQSHSFSCKWHNFIFLCGWVIFYGICIPYFLWPTIGCWKPQLILRLLWTELQWTWICRYLSCILIFTPIDRCPRMVWQGYKVALVLVFFLGTSILTSTLAALVYIPTNSVWGFLFPHILPSIYYCLFSWWLSMWLGWAGISV